MSSNEEDDSSSADDADYVPDGEISEGDETIETETQPEEEIVDPVKQAQDKAKANNLWETFKAGVSNSKAPENKTKADQDVKQNQTESKPTNSENSVDKSNGVTTSSLPQKLKDTVTITKVYNFAGEDVTVTKEVKKDSKEAQNHLKEQESSKEKPTKTGFLKKRPGGGIGSVLGKLGKKPKLSTLEKSKLDWDTYKTDEGIEDELQSYKKGKEGYLEKVQFLERTDMRQFQREKDMRLGRMAKR